MKNFPFTFFFLFLFAAKDASTSIRFSVSGFSLWRFAVCLWTFFSWLSFCVYFVCGGRCSFCELTSTPGTPTPFTCFQCGGGKINVWIFDDATTDTRQRPSSSIFCVSRQVETEWSVTRSRFQMENCLIHHHQDNYEAKAWCAREMLRWKWEKSDGKIENNMPRKSLRRVKTNTLKKYREKLFLSPLSCSHPTTTFGWLNLRKIFMMRMERAKWEEKNEK